MAKRKSFNGNSAMNMGSMLAKAQKMQADMAAAQAEAEQAEVEAAAGGGAVTVKANGAKRIIGIRISPEAADPDDIEMLEDLIIAAVNEALSKAENLMQSKIGAVTGGIDLGGMF